MKTSDRVHFSKSQRVVRNDSTPQILSVCWLRTVKVCFISCLTFLSYCGELTQPYERGNERISTQDPSMPKASSDLNSKKKKIWDTVGAVELRRSWRHRKKKFPRQQMYVYHLCLRNLSGGISSLGDPCPYTGGYMKGCQGFSYWVSPLPRANKDIEHKCMSMIMYTL